ncbi:MAG: NAD(P)(+) transhydrogenase (Re/Si-specific) subunit beta, partial [Xanthomonadales bacterium]|nr:NAD(P)(+) transhydrogenase (Re/Si-specific) subunit beta [Xanthomonadales bacterium]
MAWLPDVIKLCYFIAAVLFIVGLKRMSSPRTARAGIVWAGVGMLLAVVATFFLPDMHHRGLILALVVAGVGVAWWSGRRVAMTAMPQMVALYNGMGGGAAAAIGAVELIAHARTLAIIAQAGVPDTSPLLPENWAAASIKYALEAKLSPLELSLAVLGVLIGAVSFSGSLIAFAKLQGWLDKRFTFAAQQIINMAVLLAAILAGIALAAGFVSMPLILLFV